MVRLGIAALNQAGWASRRFAAPSTGNPQISVVITCFNQASFLRDAIESVLNQTVAPAQVILVDDGSTDRTPEVASQYPMIRYVRQENQGLSAARNTGIREARGDYLVFLDADDRLLPTALASGLRCFDAHPECAFVSGDHRVIDSSGSAIGIPGRVEIGSDAYENFLRGNYIGMHATVLYRRNVFDLVGGYDASLQACEDYDLYLRVARLFPVARHDEVVAEYRRHDDNMSNDINVMLEAVFAVLHAQVEHLGDDQKRRDALNAGLEIWKNYYARIALARFPRQFGPRHARLMAWAALRLLRHAPAQVAFGVYRRVRRAARPAFRALMPKALSRRLLGPPVGTVNFGDLRRTKPIACGFGYRRGRPVDRYYIEAFLERHAEDIRGRVLEIGDDSYTRRYGGGRVIKSDVLHAVEGNPQATFVGDLTKADHIPSEVFDCVILTQTLHLIYDVASGLRTVHRILKPGGVLLLTVPGISQLDEFGQPEDNKWGSTWYWAFTSVSLRRVCQDVFGDSMVQVESHGNVLAATAYLHGLATEELSRSELDNLDPLYQLVITARVMKLLEP